MRILELQIEGRGLPESIPFSAKPRANESKNWITVLSGENGTRKSVLLRMITGAGLNKSLPSTNHKWGAKANLVSSGPVRQVMAVSGTYSDRFPLVAGVPISRPLGGFDLDNFSYFGPKYASNVAGRGRMAAGLLLSMLEHPIESSERAKSVLAVLQCLGYSTNVRALVTPRKVLEKPDRTSQLVRQQVTRALNNVKNSEAEYAKKIVAFLEGLESANDIASAVAGPLQHRDIVLQLDIPGARETAAHAALVPFLKTGLLNVVELEFQRVKEDGQEYVSVEDLSSGQLQLLNSLLNLALCVQDDSLVLIDEPENSLHPEWQRDYISLLRRSLACVKRCHVVVATHSPLVASGVRRGEGSLIYLRRNPDDDGLEVTLNETVHGWLPSAVLEDRFDMETVRAPELSMAVETALSILKTPNGDKERLRRVCGDLRKLLAELPADDVIAPAIEAIIELSEA